MTVNLPQVVVPLMVYILVFCLTLFYIVFKWAFQLKLFEKSKVNNNEISEFLETLIMVKKESMLVYKSAVILPEYYTQHRAE